MQTHAEATFDQVVPKNRNFPGGGWPCRGGRADVFQIVLPHNPSFRAQTDDWTLSIRVIERIITLQL